MGENVDSKAISTIEEIRGLLEKRTNRQLYELVKRFDIQFPERSKAGKRVLVQQLLEHVGPNMISAERMRTELDKLPSADQLRTRITKGDLDGFREEVGGILRSIRDTHQTATADLQKGIEQVKEEVSTIARNQSFDQVRSVEGFLREVRKFDSDLTKPEDFDAALEYFHRRGIEKEEVAKLASLFVSLNSTKRLARELSWPEDLDTFYRALKAELDKIETFGVAGIPISEARGLLQARLGINRDTFNRQLLACSRRGWLTLDISSPIGQDTLESLELEGRRYTLIRALRKS